MNQEQFEELAHRVDTLTEADALQDRVNELQQLLNQLLQSRLDIQAQMLYSGGISALSIEGEI